MIVFMTNFDLMRDINTSGPMMRVPAKPKPSLDSNVPLCLRQVGL
jgi:hypothetical protein